MFCTSTSITAASLTLISSASASAAAAIYSSYSSRYYAPVEESMRCFRALLTTTKQSWSSLSKLNEMKRTKQSLDDAKNADLSHLCFCFFSVCRLDTAHHSEPISISQIISRPELNHNILAVGLLVAYILLATSAIGYSTS